MLSIKIANQQTEFSLTERGDELRASFTGAEVTREMMSVGEVIDRCQRKVFMPRQVFNQLIFLLSFSPFSTWSSSSVAFFSHNRLGNPPYCLFISLTALRYYNHLFRMMVKHFIFSTPLVLHLSHFENPRSCFCSPFFQLII